MNTKSKKVQKYTIEQLLESINEKKQKKAYDEMFYDVLLDALSKNETEPKPIEVTITKQFEDKFSMLEENQEADEILKFYYGMDYSYSAFHNRVWHELSPAEKIISCIWMTTHLAGLAKKPEIAINIEFGDSRVIEYKRDKKDNKYTILLSARKIMSPNIKPYKILKEIIEGNNMDTLRISSSRIINGLQKDMHSKLLLVNSNNPVEKPACYNKFVMDGKLNEKEERQLAIYYAQPITQMRAYGFEMMKDFINSISDALEVKDEVFNVYKSGQEKLNDNLEKLATKHLGDNDKREKYFKGHYKEEITNLDRIAEDNLENLFN
jgi:hypothetical protein